MRPNFGMKLKKIHQKLAGQELKILAYLVLPIYWAIILMVIFLQ